MPRIYLTSEEREENRFCDFVRGTLKRNGLRHKDLADALNLPTVSITQRINGKSRWTLPEMIQTLHFLGCTYTLGDSK